MTTSFPFLKIAKDYGVPYGEVIRMVENIASIPEYKYLVNWERAVVAAFLTEAYRRKLNTPQMVAWSDGGDYTSWKGNPDSGMFVVSEAYRTDDEAAP